MNECSQTAPQDTISSLFLNIDNGSIGRDGESAYETYVRLGGQLTEQQWIDSMTQQYYAQSNW